MKSAGDESVCAAQYLILAWAENRKDIEVIWKQLSQVSSSAAALTSHAQRYPFNLTKHIPSFSGRPGACRTSCTLRDVKPAR